jgi:cell division protein FtsA
MAPQAVGLLDVGTSKTACLIVALPRPGADGGAAHVQVLGAGVTASCGVRDGRIVSLDAAEQTVRSAVEEAERAAGITLEDVVVAVSGGELRLQRFTAHTRITGKVVTAADVARTMAGARSYAERDGRALLHVVCHGYRLDGAADIADPAGLAGQRLGADLGAVTTATAQLSNLLHVVERAYLRPLLVAPAPCAAAYAATSAEERRSGVIAADLGAGGTSWVLFSEGRPMAIAVLPIGGDHITRDLARAFSVTTREAERIKRVCPSVAEARGRLLAPAVQRSVSDALLARPAGRGAGAAAAHADRADAARGQRECAPADAAAVLDEARAIVRDRLVDLIGRMREAILRQGLARRPLRLVVSGGASRQAGLCELAASLTGIPAHLARTKPAHGLPPDFVGGEYAVVRGLAEVACDPATGMRTHGGGARAKGYLRRVGQWLQESF